MSHIHRRIFAAIEDRPSGMATASQIAARCDLPLVQVRMEVNALCDEKSLLARESDGGECVYSIAVASDVTTVQQRDELCEAERMWRDRLGKQRWRDDPRALRERSAPVGIRPPWGAR